MIVRINKRSKALQQWLYACILFASTQMLPALVNAQSPPPPGPGGGNPDDPLAVPFDPKMTILLLAVSVAFAIVTYKKMLKNRTLPGIR